MIAWIIGLVAGCGATVIANRSHVARSIVIGWAILAALAATSVARALFAPDDRPHPVTAIAPDFAIPNDVRGLQGTSNLDSFASQPDGSIALIGWIVDERTHAAGDGMYVDIDGTMRIVGRYGIARADVAAAMRASTAINSGFTATIQPSLLPSGAHRIRLGIIIGNNRFESVRRYAIVR